MGLKVFQEIFPDPNHINSKKTLKIIIIYYYSNFIKIHFPSYIYPKVMSILSNLLKAFISLAYNKIFKY